MDLDLSHQGCILTFKYASVALLNFKEVKV